MTTLTHRERIGRAMELLGPALNKFITTAVASELPAEATWIDLLRTRDKERGAPATKVYAADDPHNGLRMLTENISARHRKNWHPFRSQLSRVHLGYATELKEIRNRLAHNDSFDSDDAHRALDTTERLLIAVGAPGEAEMVKDMRVELRRRSSAPDTVISDLSTVGSDNLPSWRDVVSPHPDVQADNFRAAEFAADLYSVATRSGNGEYHDAVEFFRRTYMTRGLTTLIDGFTRRVTGDPNASPVVNLHTNFGGGKTHSMLALWHLASGRPAAEFPDDVAAILLNYQFDSIKDDIRRVALVGHQIQPTGMPIKPDGTQVRTLWGEMAWQLGGRKAYDMVADSDRTSTNPGAALRELFSRFRPAIVLIDEWVAYARQLYDHDGLPGGSVDTQFTFAQALTEAATAVLGVQVVISLPASHDIDTDSEADAEEVGGENGRAALTRLSAVIGRTADAWTPADAHESFEIVRRRLFQPPDRSTRDEVHAVSTEIMKFYRKYAAEFPREVTDNAYADQLRRCYPIHPELFARLYGDWSTLHRFQRTRGVLRLMNSIVGELWRSHDAAPLIMPGSIPLQRDNVVSELTQYLNDGWKPIVHTDLDGPDSVPAHVDSDYGYLGKRNTAERLARTIFFGATPTLTSAHRGLDKQQIFLGTALPGDIPGNFHSALDHLANRSTYLYVDGTTYWYSQHPNTTRAALDYAASLSADDVHAEVERRLLTAFHNTDDNSFAGIYVFPAAGVVADDQETRLVIAPMEYTHTLRANQSRALTWARNVLERRGEAVRVHKNTLIFLAAEAKRAPELDKAVREYLAWNHVADDSERLTGYEVKQAKARADQANDVVVNRISETFVWAIYPYERTPGTTYELHALDTKGSAIDLIVRTARKLIDAGELVVQRGADSIRLDLDNLLPALWAEGHVDVARLFDCYTTYPYLARMRDREVLYDAIMAADNTLIWKQDAFAIADSFDGNRYHGLKLPNDPGWPRPIDSTLIVKPDIAQRQRDDDLGNDDSTRCFDDNCGHSPEAPNSPTTLRVTQFRGVVELGSDNYMRRFNDVATEVLSHLANASELSLRLVVTANTTTGFDNHTVRTVRENSTTLRFESNDFEID